MNMRARRSVSMFSRSRSGMNQSTTGYRIVNTIFGIEGLTLQVGPICAQKVNYRSAEPEGSMKKGGGVNSTCVFQDRISFTCAPIGRSVPSWSLMSAGCRLGGGPLGGSYHHL